MPEYYRCWKNSLKLQINQSRVPIHIEQINIIKYFSSNQANWIAMTVLLWQRFITNHEAAVIVIAHWDQFNFGEVFACWRDKNHFTDRYIIEKASLHYSQEIWKIDQLDFCWGQICSTPNFSNSFYSIIAVSCSAFMYKNIINFLTFFYVFFNYFQDSNWVSCGLSSISSELIGSWV